MPAPNADWLVLLSDETTGKHTVKRIHSEAGQPTIQPGQTRGSIAAAAPTDPAGIRQLFDTAARIAREKSSPTFQGI